VIEDAGSGKQDADNDCKFDCLIHKWWPSMRDKATPAAPGRRLLLSELGWIDVLRCWESS
jgi:hypothetical protein